MGECKAVAHDKQQDKFPGRIGLGDGALALQFTI